MKRDGELGRDVGHSHRGGLDAVAHISRSRREVRVVDTPAGKNVGAAHEPQAVVTSHEKHLELVAIAKQNYCRRRTNGRGRHHSRSSWLNVWNCTAGGP